MLEGDEGERSAVNPGVIDRIRDIEPSLIS